MPYSMSKAARLAGVSKTTMHKWVTTGKVSSRKLDDGTYSIDESELARWMQAREQVSSTPSGKERTPNNLADSSRLMEQAPTPLKLDIYRADTLLEVKYAAALEAVSYERKLLREQVGRLTEEAKRAHERAALAEERNFENVQTITRLLEDQRATPKRKKFLGLF